jgi:hypothetical protein
MQLTNLRTIKNYFPQSPIQRTEYNHQMSQRATGWWGQVRAFLDGILVVMAAFAILLCLTDTFGLDRSSPPAQFVNSIMGIFVVIVIIQHFLTMIRTLALSSNSIVRERERQSWELLVLTGVDPQTVVRGKWVATVQSQWKPYLLLGVLRAGAAIWYGYSNPYLYVVYNSLNRLPSVAPPTVGRILLALVVILLLTQMNLLYTAAVGLRASVHSERATSAVLKGILHRIFGVFILVIGTAGVTVVIILLLFIIRIMGAYNDLWSYDQFYETVIFPIGNVLLRVIGSIMDNGAGIAVTVAHYANNDGLILLGGIVVTLILLVVYWLVTQFTLSGAAYLLTHKIDIPQHS